MSRPAITVLTDPLPWGRDLIFEVGRQVARRLRDLVRRGRPYFDHPTYRGHFAVTRSLVQGLQSIDASFNYNVRFPWELADTVIVLAGVRTLRQAIELKRQGKIKRLFAGPNIVVFSSDENSLLASAEIDAVVTPCNLVNELYLEDNPSLKDKIFSWPAGVDCKYWTPGMLEDKNRILIFEKQTPGPVGPVEPYAEYLRLLGWPVEVIKYGEFSHAIYRQKLQQSCLMLGFVTAESQGIAWAEAWAADVPTLIWKNTSNVWGGRRYSCSTAPYLNQKTGLFFDDLDDFKVQFAYWESHRDQFAPRAWTLENMSDEVCAAQLYNKAIQC